ncbi:Hypothetical predicted protein [Podarcis lilfordi]|uniref:Uncharacterized protein n=1 Tax=Podarcis lilfordi TaxID=74358 RepID=A0AA35PP24_9SAUR|nr:Hypothetical predicted protein [Podarcis lilfordi]
MGSLPYLFLFETGLLKVQTTLRFLFPLYHETQENMLTSSQVSEYFHFVDQFLPVSEGRVKTDYTPLGARQKHSFLTRPLVDLNNNNNNNNNKFYLYPALPSQSRAQGG